MSIYFEDCLNLLKIFPLLYSLFLQGDFIIHQSLRKSSALAMDQTLEMTYNKGPGGVIGYTRRKESVAKWNLTKQEKAQILGFMDDICDIRDSDEYSIHYEYSELFSESEEENIRIIKSFLDSRSDLLGAGKLSNMATGTELPMKDVDFLLSCYTEGQDRYELYRKQRLIDSDVKILIYQKSKYS